MTEKATKIEVKKGKEIDRGLFLYEFALGAKDNPFFDRYENFTYTLYSKRAELSQEQVIEEMEKGAKSIITTDGLCSNTTQWVNNGSSVIQSIAEAMDSDTFIFSVSGPGFGGSKLKDEQVNQQTVSTASYRTQMREFAKKMKIKTKRAVLVGHSMAAEMAADMSEDFGQVVLLNPAVHLGLNKEFVTFSAANRLAIVGDWIGKKEDWVDPIIGGITRLFVGADKDNPQNTVHALEVKNNFWAYVAKCRELAKPDDYKIWLKDPTRVHILFGGGDILTPAKDARVWFVEALKHNKIPDPEQALELMGKWLEEIDLSAVPHDGVMITPDLAKLVGDKIGALSRAIVVKEVVPREEVVEIPEAVKLLELIKGRQLVIADLVNAETFEKLDELRNKMFDWQIRIKNKTNTGTINNECWEYFKNVLLSDKRFLIGKDGIDITQTDEYKRFIDGIFESNDGDFWFDQCHSYNRFFGVREPDWSKLDRDYHRERYLEVGGVVGGLNGMRGIVAELMFYMTQRIGYVGYVNQSNFDFANRKMIDDCINNWDRLSEDEE